MTTAAPTGFAMPPAFIRCVACGGQFAIAEDAKGEPMALHNSPSCAEFDALDTSDDAVNFSRRCRLALGDLRDQ